MCGEVEVPEEHLDVNISFLTIHFFFFYHQVLFLYNLNRYVEFVMQLDKNVE